MRPITPLAAVLVALTAAPAQAADCEPSVATPVPQPSQAQLDAAGLGGFPIAPPAKRVDLVAAPFNDSTAVTNPLFPISSLHSAVLNGRADGEPLKIETTLLPETRVIEWSPGQCVKTLVSQFVAYKAGRIEEVALDFYAQDDTGAVWYFGEDVFNYGKGGIADTGGSWLAGKEGPAAMIMPAQPRVGNVNRSENIPGLVFEEVTTKTLGLTLRGPRGPVSGVMVGSELHDTGEREDKYFAPGYGEFRSAGGGDLEAMALAVPTDARPGPVPATLRRLYDAALNAYAEPTRRAARRAAAAWRAHRSAPPRLVAPMNRAVAALPSRTAALHVAQAALDLQLQYRPPAEIDRERLALWARRVVIDARRRNAVGVNGDVTTMEWIRDRITRAVDPVALVRIDRRLTRLRAQVSDGELRAAARTARRFF